MFQSLSHFVLGCLYLGELLSSCKSSLYIVGKISLWIYILKILSLIDNLACILVLKDIV